MGELRDLVRHPQMTSLEILSGSGTATLRRREVTVNVPMAEFRDRMRGWGWQGENCNRPLMVFGDDAGIVQKSVQILREEGFTSVTNARTRSEITAALKRPPAHIREPVGQDGSSSG